MPTVTLDTWFSPTQVAQLIGVSYQRVRQLPNAGRLRYISTPLGRLIDPDDLARFAVKRQTAR